MVELRLGPAAARRTDQGNGGIHLGDARADGVALRVQRGSVSCCALNIVGHTRVIALIGVIGGALRG